ncbi:MAG: hypothetical protein ACOVMK_03785 [Arenimonas sp.]
MTRIIPALAAVALLSACSEPPKHQIVFTHEDTCKIIINDLQYGQANETERHCVREPASGPVQAVTVNFLSETCNAYRYTLTGAREGSDGEFAFKAEENVPNPGCNFIPQYSDVNVRWVLNPQ